MGWLMMEVNLISFLPLITTSRSLKKLTILYFVVQRIGSLSLLICGVLFDRIAAIAKGMALGLILKRRIAPLHFWGTLLVPHLIKLPAYTFLTWQKIAPVFLLMTTSSK